MIIYEIGPHKCTHTGDRSYFMCSTFVISIPSSCICAVKLLHVIQPGARKLKELGKADLDLDSGFKKTATTTKTDKKNWKEAQGRETVDAERT